MGWMDLALTAIGIVAVIAMVVRALRRPSGMSDRLRSAQAGRADPLHRQAAHYRASGALPRWDP
jgi:hypothetical protein